VLFTCVILPVHTFLCIDLQSEEGTGENGQGPQSDVFVMGNSAGGIHLATWLLEPQFEAARRCTCQRAGLCVSAARYCSQCLFISGTRVLREAMC
jgi:hypothetical protein